jgi:hypothetical protein
MTDEKKPGPDPLSSLWQSALGQIDEIRDVIVRGSQAGKAKLDVQLLKRTRDKVLQQLGERLVEEHRRGAAPLPEGCEDLVKKLEETEKQIEDGEREAAAAFKR